MSRHVSRVTLRCLKGPALIFLPTSGFIGSHTALSLLEHGYKITVIDNLDNSFQLAVDRVAELAGDKAANMKFVQADLRDFDALDKLFEKEKLVFVVINRQNVGKSKTWHILTR
jgi:UDP-glucose 4-epimerase